MKFEQEKSKIKLSLPNHIAHVLQRLNINYRSSIGLLNHIAQLTRPNISYAELKLTLQIKEPSQLLQIISDTSWGDDPQGRTSQSGYLCFIFGSLISWNSCKQISITYLSTEAELNPLVDSFHKGVWLALLAEVWNIQITASNHIIDDPELQEILMMMDKYFEEKHANEHLIANKGSDNKFKSFGSNPKT
ncbi:uncharacterized protein VP01_3128g2 [Puccinia sorghi]|uniref:Reverse transcriptase Ty1/copia-type domain-containing protein n=1 Tax=Puccinia sorghi TaxID=27349 RepID=A0A0L6UZ57_9BASI|nr:uncharacterized protein VP01_3128g2 [Puccinia sorghi]